MSTLTRQFDPLFRRHGAGLPVNFLRALAKKESGLNPTLTGGSYWGILQVGYNNVLPGFNARKGTSYTKNDLLDPDKNIRVATDLLGRIVASYKRNHSNVANMQPNWSNPEFVKLLLAGWNSGYSEAGGVGRVASYLEKRGIPVTHDNVFKHARAAGATKHLSNTSKQRWQAQVADLFYQEGGPGTSILLTGALAAFVLWGAHKLLS